MCWDGDGHMGREERDKGKGKNGIYHGSSEPAVFSNTLTYIQSSAHLKFLKYGPREAILILSITCLYRKTKEKMQF